MHWLGWIIIILALFEGGWLAFDGSRALVVGDYVTPTSGPYAGQLGPWSKVAAAAGIDPRSTFMKWIHIILGAAWIAAAVGFAVQQPWSWWGLLSCAILSLWYIPIGTILGLVQIILLLLTPLRS